jgi:anti-sigma factor RsiW
MNCREINELLPLHSCGELDPARAAEFAAHLTECPSCADVVRRQEYYDARLRAIVLSDDASGAAAATAERVNQKVRLQIASSRVMPFPSTFAVPRRLAVAAMGIAALLVFAMLGYHGLFSPQVGRVYADAAQDHQLEVVEQQPRRWLTDPQQIALLGSRVGVPENAVLALAPASYHLVRGKVCLLDGYAFLHLVFSDGTPSDGSHEFSLYLRPRGVGQLPRVSWHVARSADGATIGECGFGSDHVAAFETPRLTVLLVTDQSADAGSALAASFSSSF